MLLRRHWPPQSQLSPSPCGVRGVNNNSNNNNSYYYQMSSQRFLMPTIIPLRLLLLHLLLATCLLIGCSASADEAMATAAKPQQAADDAVVLAVNSNTNDKNINYSNNNNHIITNNNAAQQRNSNSHVPLVVSNLNISATQTTAASPPSSSSASSASFAVPTIKIAAAPMAVAAAVVATNAQKVPLRRHTNNYSNNNNNASSSDYNAGVTLNFAPPSQTPSTLPIPLPLPLPLPPSVVATMALPQTPAAAAASAASHFHANFNNQQNVMQLARNIEARLRSIRNVEMRVTTIQEIFDAMHVSSSSASSGVMKNRSDGSQQQQQAVHHASYNDDLQQFSKRLEKKLLKATHVVRELRDFFRYNVTRLMLHHQAFYRDEDDEESNNNDDDDDDDDIDGGDDDDDALTNIDEFDGGIGVVGGDGEIESIFLKSYILESLPPMSSVAYAMENFNYKMKTETKQSPQQQQQQQQQQFFPNDRTFVRARAKYRLSMEANAYIADKVQSLRSTLTHSNSDIDDGQPQHEMLFGGRQASSAKHKLVLGSHLKHVYFLARTDSGGPLDGGNQEKCSGGSGGATSQPSDANFRHLLVAAVQRKYVMLVIDVGSSASAAELSELSKAIVSSVLQLLSPTDLITLVTIADAAHYVELSGATATADDAAAAYGHNGNAGAGVYTATADRKDEIQRYIQNLRTTTAPTNHTLAMEFAFRMLHRLQNASILTVQNPIQFLYITRGVLISSGSNNKNNGNASADVAATQQILRVIGNGQRKLYEPIVINMCVVVVDKKRLLHEEQFLNDIARQNYTKYDVNVADWLPPGDVARQQRLIGMFYVLFKAHAGLLLQACTDIFTRSFQKRYLSDSLEVHAPVMDSEGKDIIVSVTHDVAPYGVVGVNLYLADLVEDIVNYHQQQQQQQRLSGSGNAKRASAYAFLMTRTGMTIAHPAFPRPSTQQQTLYPVDIGYLENATDFMAIRQRMLHEESGSVNTTITTTMPTSITTTIEHRKQQQQSNNRGGMEMIMQRTYHWQRILGIYVLCLATTTKRVAATTHTGGNQKSPPPAHATAMPMVLQRYNQALESHMPHASSAAAYGHSLYDFTATEATGELVYHRLDLMPPANALVCRYFHQIATLDAITLYFGAIAFESPFAFLHGQRMSACSPHAQLHRTQAIMAYIRDATGLVENPGLRPHIRKEVNALFNAMQHLKQRHLDERGVLKHHIIRRYIATVSGVLQVYPGCQLAQNYDATRRSWFRKALQQPGKVVTTSPYLDAGGAGYIVTIAHTIFEGKANALHSIERDQPIAVVALDLPYAYYYKLILDTTALCQAEHIKCLLFENEGYLIAHPSMLEVSTPLRNARRPHEHLTHKESYLANDILNHKTLVRKLACANYQNRTLQRYYVFNTSLSEILTNVVHGERTKYAISLVRNTNIFAAVLNSTCDGGAFCPCSTIDRTCLNCKRMDRMDCECPCECPMDMRVFDDHTVAAGDGDDLIMGGVMQHAATANARGNYTLQYAYCEPPSEHFMALPALSSDYHLLPACVSSNCDVYGTQLECMAVMDCVWCQQDVDGNGFTASFCAAQSACFNGVLSSLTPYGEYDDDILLAHGYNPGQKPNATYSAFGPIGGAIIVLVLVIGFAIYCYRHNVDAQTTEQFYIDSMQEENYGLPLSRFNFDDCQAHDEPPPPGNGNGYDHSINLIHPADISPYHMSTGSSYRRPPNGESDHGYSTMTPHEDSSDHQCFTLAEPLLLNDKQQRHSKSDTLSISTSISSPTNRHQQHHHQSHPHHHHSSHQQQPSHHQQQQHHHYMPGKEARYNLTSPKKYQHHAAASSPATGRLYEQTALATATGATTLPDGGNELTTPPPPPPISPRYILAPVTVHRHMETSES